ncbi:MAG: hypothetical protein WC483_03640, partial [Candidatus Paceibacterota bacterium]
ITPPPSPPRHHHRHAITITAITITATPSPSLPSPSPPRHHRRGEGEKNIFYVGDERGGGDERRWQRGLPSADPSFRRPFLPKKTKPRDHHGQKMASEIAILVAKMRTYVEKECMSNSALDEREMMPMSAATTKRSLFKRKRRRSRTAISRR